MKHEQEFNHLLAKALRSANPAWRLSVKVEESRMLKESAANRVDILIAGDNAPPVAIETSYQRGDADADAVARLGFHYEKTMMEIRTAIAVDLDDSCRHLTRITKKNFFNYAIHQKIPNGVRRFPATGFIRGSYLDLARLAATAPTSKEDMEEVATDVACCVNAAADLLKDAIPAHHLEDISLTMYQRSALTGLRTTALLWLNAMLVQRMLIGGVHNIPVLTTNPTECI